MPTDKEKYNKIFWIILILINICILLILFIIMFSSKDYSVNQKENSYFIGASYMTMNNEFYKIISEEISAKIETENDRLIVRDPALDANRQNDQINDMLDMGIDVLIVTPVEWKSLTPVLKRAKQQNVLVIVVDTNVYDEDFVDCTITSDNYDAGVIVGKYFLEQCETAKLVIMTHETTKSGQDRVKGFLDTIKNQNGIEIVDKIECKGQSEIAMPELQKIIDEKIYFDNIFCLNDLASVGVVAALEENNMLNDVDVYGVDASPDSKALIKEGMMKASAVQFPSQIGKKVADVIYKLLNKEDVKKNILMPVELVTKDNIDEFGIGRWQ
ncbi:MAG: sugar ABC transporter substrate-binding protein [Firmicutes bacterium]|nr:sugar ABC transporter substrate-binding protein [Bacillota bacterium]